MTREDAIKIIKEDALYNPEVAEMAIKALEQELSYEIGYNDAKREIALIGEYERAYERGKLDAEQTRWIPVSERLPETDNENNINNYNVLLWVKNKLQKLCPK